MGKIHLVNDYERKLESALIQLQSKYQYICSLDPLKFTALFEKSIILDQTLDQTIQSKIRQTNA